MSTAYVPRRLAGRCADGVERGAGRNYHALPERWSPTASALCGKRPGRLSGGWIAEPGDAVTCPKCYARLQSR